MKMMMMTPSHLQLQYRSRTVVCCTHHQPSSGQTKESAWKESKNKLNAQRRKVEAQRQKILSPLRDTVKQVAVAEIEAVRENINHVLNFITEKLEKHKE
jgi:hypothetical protein